MVAAVTAAHVATMASLIRRMVTPYVLALIHGLNWGLWITLSRIGLPGDNIREVPLAAHETIRWHIASSG